MSDKNKSQLIIYQTETGETKLDVRFQNETVWLTQKMMTELFQVTVPTINEHIKNIFDEGELKLEVTIRKFLIVQKEGIRKVTRKVVFYNLDMIISVGYRVKSKIATHFRQWATRHLREFIVKGFVLDDERLKNPNQPFDYYNELMRRIQDIRTSERRFYQKITDIYATSIDYDPTDEMSIEFFKTVQDKMHWAITGKTAAEIIHKRADNKKLNMGLTNWRGTKIRKDDIEIAKNYLNKNELLALNNLVEQYLIFAEGRAMRRIPMYMKNWISKLDSFLQLNEREILTHAGKISHQIAMETAKKEYKKYSKKRQIDYDKKGNAFDVLVNETKKIGNKKGRRDVNTKNSCKP